MLTLRTRGRDPDATFGELLREYVPGGLKGPFNLDARRAAGFGDRELERLADARSDTRGSGAHT